MSLQPTEIQNFSQIYEDLRVMLKKIIQKNLEKIVRLEFDKIENEQLHYIT